MKNIVNDSPCPAADPRRVRSRAAARGFSLVEMALVLLIVGALAAAFLPLTNSMLDNNRRKETRAKLEALEQAMVRFVMVNRRLPCPADGALGVGNNNSGVELRNAAVTPATCTAMVRGVVPWRSLGLDAGAATDSWGNLITYRVWARTSAGAGSAINTSLAMDTGMDFSACDPSNPVAPVAPEYRCTTTQSQPRGALTAGLAQDARGMRVCRRTPCDATALPAPPGINEVARRVDGNGAAYFLISHGANKFGAYTTSGALIATATGPGPGPREVINQNNQDLRAANLNSTFYIDAEYDENQMDYFDDLVLYRSVLAVAMAANLGPRKPP